MAHVIRELQTAGSKRFFSHNKFGAKAPTFIDKLKPVTDWHATDSNNDPHFLQATPKDIIGIIRNYYEFLYEDKPSDVKAANILLDELRGRKLISQPRKTCEGDITPNELLGIMNKIPVNKSAGPDKIPGLFYKIFKTELAPILATVLNTSKKLGYLPKTLREGTVSILYKKKDREDIRNYRPITLLNL